ncbi:hypothetical protein BX600DRAFT_442974 [Xylariales sp. PMI_506]|nr:hypothetical protein BX600DRAFT_442974 [Xylariales sp. PMI_506]
MGSEALPDQICTLCSNLRRMFSDSKFHISLGLFDEVLKIPCPGHDPLLHFIRDDFDQRISTLFLEEDDEVSAEGCDDTQDEVGGEDDRPEEGAKLEGITKNEEGEESGTNPKPWPGPHEIHLGWIRLGSAEQPAITVETSSMSIY